ncbi:hypothetical protein G6F37_001846 [Rhizopus arrhizus]|nr:hypothetical protein G6F38_002267 [Rhizopus arrhizus]KAG1162763.1 hypothetical protein G6F37_001846 [Rhizopus arrhizus]
MSKNNQDYNLLLSSTNSPEANHILPSAPPSEAGLELPTYDNVIAASSSVVPVHALHGKPVSGNNNITSTSDADCSLNPNSVTIPMPTAMPMPMPMPMPTLAPFPETADYDLLEDEYNEEQELLVDHADFQGRPPPPDYSLYKAKFKTSRTGNVSSRDKHINEDGEALLQFLHQHNSPPSLIARFYGYHEETHWITRTRRNSNGEEETEQEPVTHRVEDFCFKIDCSNYVSPYCRGVYVLPDPKTGEIKRVRQLCDEYIHSENAMKELKLNKQVDWDFETLTTALTNAIRNAGFLETVEITFQTEKDEITFGHSILKSRWDMSISEANWYQLHAQEIIIMCRNKVISKGKPSKLSVVPPLQITPQMPIIPSAPSV